MSKLIIDERPLLVPPTLASKIGLNEAVVLQQIHFLSTISDNEIDGRNWVYNSYDDWQKHFPLWSKPTIVRIFKRLKDADLTVTGKYNKRAYDRTMWEAVKYTTLSEISNGETARWYENDKCYRVEK